MAHTHTFLNTRFIANSDMSGDITAIDLRTKKEIEIDGEDFKNFIAEYVRTKRIERLERMSTEELLGGE